MIDIFVFFLLVFGVGSFFFAPWVPSKSKDIERLFDLLKPSSSDVIYDLGCGDGRLGFYFAKRGIRSVGFEISPFLYMWCQIKKWLTGAEKAEFVFWNFLHKDFTNATIVYIFGLDRTINKNSALREKLERELQSGTRVVSYLFSIDWLTPTVVHKDPNGMSMYVYEAINSRTET